MTKDNYCIHVCGGKCCFWWEEQEPIHVCPHLTKEKRCRVHDNWEKQGHCSETYTVLSTSDELHTVHTQPIMRLLEEGVVPEWIVEQCCYVHPELLKEAEQ